MTKPIAISISPNTQSDDASLALKLLFQPWRWNQGQNVQNLEKEFELMFPSYIALAINSGRSALYLLLKSLGIKAGDEVIIQAFTCVVVPNSILWTGATPIYVDIDDTLNIDVNDLKQKITSKTKAIIVQHTFGIPANMKEIQKLAKEKGILLIEDCAHALGAKYQGKLVGTFGDMAFFSFGRDKIISSVFGGMIISSNTKLLKQIQSEYQKLPAPSSLWIFQQLLHPIIFESFLKPFYNHKVVRGLLSLFQKLKLLSLAVKDEEKKSIQPSEFPAKMANALATLALNQLKKLDRFNSHRAEIVEIYGQSLKTEKIKAFESVGEPSWLRYPVYVENAKNIISRMRRYSIFLGDWYQNVIMPCNDLTAVKYELGSCPKAEEISNHIVNLPTFPGLSKEEAKKVAKLFLENE